MFTEEIKRFLNCIKSCRKPLTSGEEERKTLAVVSAGYESLKRSTDTGKVLTVLF